MTVDMARTWPGGPDAPSPPTRTAQGGAVASASRPTHVAAAAEHGAEVRCPSPRLARRPLKAAHARRSRGGAPRQAVRYSSPRQALCPSRPAHARRSRGGAPRQAVRYPSPRLARCPLKAAHGRQGHSGAPGQVVRYSSPRQALCPLQAGPRTSGSQRSTAPGGAVHPRPGSPGGISWPAHACGRHSGAQRQAVRCPPRVEAHGPNGTQNSKITCLRMVDTFRTKPRGSRLRRAGLLRSPNRSLCRNSQSPGHPPGRGAGRGRG